MADVITRFKLETTQYDSKLRDASKTLSEFARQASFAGKDFDKFTKGNVEAARAFGNISTSATNAKDKVKELVGAYNDMARSYNMLSKEQQQSDWAKAMAQSMQTLKGRISEAKKEMQELQNATKSAGSGGGLFSGDKLSGMLQVFGGNLMTKATGMAVGTIANFASELGDAVKQGIELAKQGEGIRIAFERLGRGDILQGLREATHGTVTDLELMKAAVKFNDFKLPVEELGTMLAFAQQKAKDTGQSVDYMVDSIVTGLGRKSLLILDNLGLSANEIKEKMKDTGDMTKAVGEIIREQMAKAGDYVETAADRAAQANVNLQNKLEEVGRKFAPLQEASTQLWTSMKLGILEVVSGPLARMLNMLTEAGRLRNTMNDLAGGNADNETNKQLRFLQNTSAGNRKARYDKQLSIYDNEIAWRKQYASDIRAWQSGKRGGGIEARIKAGQRRTGSDFLDAAKMEREAQSFQMFRIKYQQGAQAILNPNKPLPPSSDTTNTPTTNIPKPRKTNIIEEVFPEGSMKDLQRDMQELKKAQDLVTSPDEWQKYQQEIDAVTEKMNALKGVIKEVKAPEMAEGVSGLNQKAISTYQSMLQESMKGMEYGSTDLTQTLANSIDVTTLSNLLTATMQQGINMTAIQLADGTTAADLWDKIVGGKNIPDSTWESLVTTINEKLASMGIEPITLNFKTGDVKGQAKEMQKDWQNAASAIQSVGSAMSQIEDPAAKVVGTVAQAVATIALGYAQATSKAAEMGPWAWIAFAATGLATMISTISSIHSATGYAQGGIVQGNSYSGDNLMAQGPGGEMIGLNAGEVVLNRAQQGNLASQLESASDGYRGTPQARISGEQIYLTLGAYLKRSGRGEILTSR